MSNGSAGVSQSSLTATSLIAVDTSADWIMAGVQPGWSARSRRLAPAEWGEAIDVPLIMLYSSGVLYAARMSEPGAITSGLMTSGTGRVRPPRARDRHAVAIDIVYRGDGVGDGRHVARAGRQPGAQRFGVGIVEVDRRQYVGDGVGLQAVKVCVGNDHCPGAAGLRVGHLVHERVRAPIADHDLTGPRAGGRRRCRTAGPRNRRRGRWPPGRIPRSRWCRRTVPGRRARR